VDEIKRDDEARDAWREIYPALSSDRPGLMGAMIARAEAHVTRLALLYALLDCSRVVTLDHLRASLAMWQYAEDSAEYVFGASLGDPMADRLLELIRANPDGISQTEIHNALGNNYPASRINAGLKQLEDLGLISKQSRNTAGRPATVWCPVRR
jgi:hypothetical protein